MQWFSLSPHSVKVLIQTPDGFFLCMISSYGLSLLTVYRQLHRASEGSSIENDLLPVHTLWITHLVNKYQLTLSYLYTVGQSCNTIRCISYNVCICL